MQGIRQDESNIESQESIECQGISVALRKVLEPKWCSLFNYPSDFTVIVYLTSLSYNPVERLVLCKLI